MTYIMWCLSNPQLLLQETMMVEEMVPEEVVLWGIILWEVFPQEVILREVIYRKVLLGRGYSHRCWIWNSCKLIKSSQNTPELAALLDRISTLSDLISTSPRFALESLDSLTP